jgi:hypothetical protein
MNYQNCTSSLSRLLATAAVALGLTGLVQASTVVLNFDDLGGFQSGASLTNYHGVSFDGNFFTYDSYQPPYNASSGNTRAAVNLTSVGPGESIFTFDTPDQYFVGAYFAGYGTNAGFLPIHFNLYNNGNLVGTSSALDLDSSGTPTWLASGYNGAVDYVGIVGYKGYFVFDDLTYSSTPTGRVPDAASTLSLMGMGLAALVALRRRVRA